MRIPDWIPIIGSRQESQSCCKATGDKAMLELLDKACRIALAIFSAFINPFLFAVSFGIGAVGSLVYVLATSGKGAGAGNLKPVCGQGYMEFLSGRSYPAWTVHVITTVFVGAHVRHDPKFFVPFCGLFIGIWVGAEVGLGALTLGQRSAEWWKAPRPPQQRCPCEA